MLQHAHSAPYNNKEQRQLSAVIDEATNTRNRLKELEQQVNHMYTILTQQITEQLHSQMVAQNTKFERLKAALQHHTKKQALFLTQKLKKIQARERELEKREKALLARERSGSAGTQSRSPRNGHPRRHTTRNRPRKVKKKIPPPSLITTFTPDILGHLFRTGKVAYTSWPVLCRRSCESSCRFDENLKKYGTYLGDRCLFYCLFAPMTVSRDNKNRNRLLEALG